MRIAELSKLSRTPSATIKYYIRAGLLPAGERINATQSEYRDSHAARLQLIKSLLQVGKLSMSKALEVLRAIDNPQLPIQEVLGVAQAAITAESEIRTEPQSQAAQAMRDLIQSRGWKIHPENPGLRMVLDVLSEFETMGHGTLYDSLDEFARAAEIVGIADISVLGSAPDRQTVIERAVVGTILGDVLFMGLRRLTQEHFSSLQYPNSSDSPPSSTPQHVEDSEMDLQ